MAIVGEGVGTGSVDALAVVLLQTGEVAVGNRDHLLPRQALRRRDRLEPDVFVLAALVHALDVVRPATPWLEEHGLDFGDAAQLDAKPHAHENSGPRLAHRPHHRDLSKLGVREDMFVVSDTARGFPEAVTNLEHLVV